MGVDLARVDGNGTGARTSPSAPGAIALSIEPALDGDRVAAVTVAIEREGLGRDRPFGLDSVWRRAGLLEAVDRAP